MKEGFVEQTELEMGNEGLMRFEQARRGNQCKCS
jgi:hypothetical protein